MGTVRPFAHASIDAARVNNFDLLRLFAASQVVFGHGRRYLDVRLEGVLADLPSYFPGVPIFFVISGFLIAGSLDRGPSLARYAAYRDCYAPCADTTRICR